MSKQDRVEIGGNNRRPMESQRSIQRKYAKLKLEPAEPNQINCYACTSCPEITKTIDIHKGTSPFVTSCFVCGAPARSSFYNDTVPDQAIDMEWHMPTLNETVKLRKHPDMLDHVLRGGLVARLYSGNK
ncbi:hypothetical protein [Pedobacter duraquae]|uniref:Uncharacterized protein n=1 Tax=Pedobacter duraquae TaxID=425511 RepID=A0A4R6IIV7_9SPHI|nr:hypothetical protein [Pedobacter duraquae]TDO21903.1 hypothetical protein CLV32_3011 [Pedobacter duraquae]